MVENGRYELYQGDCLEVMDGLISLGVKFDAIITDPPYGTTACKWDSIIPFDRYIVIEEGKRYKILYKDEFMLRKFKEGINIKEAEKEWKENSKEGMWDKLNKLIKPNGAILLFGSEPFSSALRMSNIKNYKYDWVWEKPQGVNPLLAKKQPLNNIEYIHVFYKKQPLYNPQFECGTPYKITRDKKERLCEINNHMFKETTTINEGKRYPKRILKFKRETGLHPTQKPVALLEYLIKTYTNEGDLVLDFTMGSGSTGVACMNTNRRFVGIELDEKYFNIAVDRMKNRK